MQTADFFRQNLYDAKYHVLFRYFFVYSTSVRHGSYTVPRFRRVSFPLARDKNYTLAAAVGYCLFIASPRSGIISYGQFSKLHILRFRRIFS